MSSAQVQALIDHLTSLGEPALLHHGCCVGVDEEAHWIAFELGISAVGHPPTDTRLMMEIPPEPESDIFFLEIREPFDYLARDRHIAEASDWLLGFPKDNSGKGGTWYTIDYARSIGKPVIVVHRDGTVDS